MFADSLVGIGDIHVSAEYGLYRQDYMGIKRFCGLFSDLVVEQAIGNRLWDVTEKVFSSYRGLLSQVQQYLYLYIPLLTMGLMSREFSSGSIKLLYSSPITSTQIVLGKFLSMMFYGLIMLAIDCNFIRVRHFRDVYDKGYGCALRFIRFIWALFVDLCLCCYRFVHVKFDILSSCCGIGDFSRVGDSELFAVFRWKYRGCARDHVLVFNFRKS